MTWRVEVSSRACAFGDGDAFTGYHRDTLFPESVRAGAADPHSRPLRGLCSESQGLVLAGHTHCGQLRVPVLGPIWVPSKAPREATCGTYREGNLTLWVSAGLGTSIAPLRFWAPARWDVVKIRGK